METAFEVRRRYYGSTQDQVSDPDLWAHLHYAEFTDEEETWKAEMNLPKRDRCNVSQKALLAITDILCPKFLFVALSLSCPGWLQKGLLPIFKNTKKIQPKNTKSELQGLENTTGWFCIFFNFGSWFPKVNMGLALWLIFEFVFSLYFVFLKFWVRIFFGILYFWNCWFVFFLYFVFLKLLIRIFFVFCIFEQLHSYFFLYFFVFFSYFFLVKIQKNTKKIQIKYKKIHFVFLYFFCIFPLRPKMQFVFLYFFFVFFQSFTDCTLSFCIFFVL